MIYNDWGSCSGKKEGEMRIGGRCRKIKGAASVRFLLAVVALGLLDACVTSYVGNPEIVKENNAILAKKEQGVPFESGASPVDADQLRRLWRDKPQYAALVGATHAKTFRIVSIAVPKYPYWEAWAKKRADVSISFIVGVDGRVEDARVYESSDSRFDQPALEAIRQFIFIPAEGPSGRPEPAIEVQPIHFEVPPTHF
jgi:TonB family protein